MSVYASVSFRDQVSIFEKIDGFDSIMPNNVGEFIQAVTAKFLDFLNIKQDLICGDREMYDITMYIHYYHDAGFALDFEDNMHEIAFSMYPNSFYENRVKAIKPKLFETINTHKDVGINQLVDELTLQFDINFKR